MYWMIAWSLCLLGWLGSFTFLGVGLVGAMLGGAGSLGSVLSRTGLALRGHGCTAAGTWRGGDWMEFCSLSVARTIRSRCAVSALSLGRSRQRCVVTGVYRRLR